MKTNMLILISLIVLTFISLGMVSAVSDESVDNLTISQDMDALKIDSSEIQLESNDDVKDIATINEKELLADDKINPTYKLDVELPEATTGSYNLQWGQSIVINGDYGNATGNVTITFDSQTYQTDLDNGIFKYEINKYTKISNNQQLKITYNGDDTYNSVSKTLYIHVKLDDVVANDAYYGLKPFITVNLYNATGNVTFKLNGKEYKRQLENGQLTQEFTNYTLGSNTVDFTYEGDDKYNGITKSLKFTTELNVEEPTIYNYQPAIIKLYLGDATGKVNFTLNEVSEIVDIVKGVASKEYTEYEIGNNTVKLEYLGDTYYNPFIKEISFTVLNKQDAEIYSAVYQNNGVNVVSIYIPYANGSANVTINGKNMIMKLVDGQALYNITAADEIYNIKVVYDGDVRLNPAKSSTFLKLDNIVTASTWKYYFNQEKVGKLFDFLPEGITLDFQGSIINPDQKNMWNFDISKSINVVSTTNDAYIDLNTTAGSLLGENHGNAFIVSNGGSGSNITGIKFHNTQLWISNTTNVVLDKISNVVENQRVGSGVGATTVRDNSSYVTIKNSYFYTKDNGGSTTFTFSWANYCTFDNNTVKIEGNVGNMLYLNVYNIAALPSITGPVNTHNKFINNELYGREGSAISVGIMVEGIYNLIENNTLHKCSISNSFGGVGSANNTYVGNILSEGSGITAQAYSIIHDNSANTLNTGENSIAYHNNLTGKMTVRANSKAYENNAGGLTLSGAGAEVYNNFVNGESTISAANINVHDNTFSGDNVIKFSSANAKNINFTNNNVVGNIEFTQNAKYNTISNNTISTSKDYAIDLKTYTDTYNTIENNILSGNNLTGDNAVNHADDDTLIVDNPDVIKTEITVKVDNIKVGETAKFEINTNQPSIKTVSLIVGSQLYSVNLVNGKATYELNDLSSGNYKIIVTSDDKKYIAKNTTQLNVTKNSAPAIIIDSPSKITKAESVSIIVSVGDATGSVTLNINGETITSPLENGIANIRFTPSDIGEFNYTVTYSGDGKYYENSTKFKLIVENNNKVNIQVSQLTFQGISSNIDIVFTDYLEKAIPNADVRININDLVYDLITDENGKVSVDLKLTKGIYKFSAVFYEIKGEYDKTEFDGNITVYQQTTISINNIETNLVSGVLKDIDGNPVTNAAIIYSIDGDNNQSTVTDNNGEFFIKATKNGLLTFIFQGDKINLASSSSIKLTNVVPDPTPTPVKKLKSTTLKVSSKKFKVKAKNKIVSATLLSGKTKLKSKLVTIKIKGKTFKAKTNIKGIANIKIKLSKKGKYTATVKFAGDSTYQTISKKINITIK